MLSSIIDPLIYLRQKYWLSLFFNCFPCKPPNESSNNERTYANMREREIAKVTSTYKRPETPAYFATTNIYIFSCASCPNCKRIA